MVSINEVLGIYLAELTERAIKAAGKAIKEEREKREKAAESEGELFQQMQHSTPQAYFEEWVEDWTGKYINENVRVNQTGMKFTTPFLDGLFLEKNDRLKMCFYEMRYNPIPRTILLTFTAEALELLGEGGEALKADPSRKTINNKAKKHFKVEGWKLGSFEVDEATKFVKEPALLKQELDLIITKGIPAFEKEMKKRIAAL